LGAVGAHIEARLGDRDFSAIVGDMPETWNDWYAWIHAHGTLWSLGVIAATLVLSITLHAVVSRLLRRWVMATESTVDDAMVTHLHGPLRLLIPMLSLWLVAPLITLPPSILGPVRHGFALVVIALVAWLLIRVLRVIQEAVSARYDIQSQDNLQARSVLTQVRGFRNIAAFAIGVVAVAFMLMTFDRVRELGVSILASAGIAGIVIGFAAQRSIATVIAGVQVALAQPIRVDDVVIVENEWGRIEEITLTYVVVRIWDLRRLIVPITYFIEKPFQNWTRVSADLLGTVFLYTDYRMPVDELRRELERILDSNDLWDGKVRGLQVTNTSERTIELRALMSAANASNAWDLRCQVRERLVAFIQEKFPEYLPRFRADIETPRGLGRPDGAPAEGERVEPRPQA
jgi:small-conductance mechanosensitive channel